MSNLSRFLVDLATNPDLKARYTNDPGSVMADAGLTSEERAALHSGDSTLMRKALGKPENECMSQTGDIVFGPGTVITEPNGKVTTLTTKAKLTCDLTTAPSAARKRKTTKRKSKKAKKGARKTAKRGKRR